MKNFKTKIMAVIAVLLLAGIYYYVALPAINIHSTGFWIFLIMLLVLAAVYYVRKKRLNRYELKTSKAVSYTHLFDFDPQCAEALDRGAAVSSL